MATHDPNINFYDNPGHPYWPTDGNWHEDGVVPGGGSVELGPLVEVGWSASDATFYVATTAFDIAGDTFLEVDGAINENANVCRGINDSCVAPSGCYIAITTAVPSDWSPENMQVNVGETAVSDFECRKLIAGNGFSAVFTMQIPSEEVCIYFNFIQ